MPPRRRKSADTSSQGKSYTHPTVETPMRPDVGTQAQFQGKMPPQTFRYDSSLSPALEWDGQNAAREEGEKHLAAILRELAEARSALAKKGNGELSAEAIAALRKKLATAEEATRSLKAMSGPFMNWAGKAERLSFDVPTLPLFVHERLSTKAIIETLKGHRRDKQLSLFDLFGDPQRPLADHLRAYEHKDKWQNRLIFGDNLPVMNSLLQYEGLGGQVQMIYMDPPYGVQYGSNFQPFVRKREVKHNDDDEMTREPEMVQAYRDTWEYGLHSYLTCLRDRFLLCRDLLHPTGSIFVQIGTENLNQVGQLLSEIFGRENLVEIISFRKKTMPLGGNLLEGNCDYLIWFAKDKDHVKYRGLFQPSKVEGDSHWNYVELSNGNRRQMTTEEIDNHGLLPNGSSVYQLIGLYPTGSFATGLYDFEFEGVTDRLPPGKCCKTQIHGINRLAHPRRHQPYAGGDTLRYVLKHSDYPVTPLGNVWQDTSAPSDKIYVVQTSNLVVQRCMLMTTDPGDLVLDPTCGSGTTAYVAEQWGRRWITIDVSRVPLALTRQRLLSATFPWYDLKDESRGPAGGLVYKRKQNRRGEEVGGIVPHLTLKSIANDESPDEEVLVDRPEVDKHITRVTGPFTVEATIPTVTDWEGNAGNGNGKASVAPDLRFPDRMIEVLRKSPLLRLEGNRTIAFENVRAPAKALTLSAEGVLRNGESRRVAFVFGPENGPVSEKLVQEAMREASIKGYERLIVIGFAIQPNARLLIERAADMGALSTLYVQATPDLLMGDLLKNMRSSQIFSVCGLPEIEVKSVKGNGKKNGNRPYQVTLLGLDVFDPVTMDVIHRTGDDVPAWLLDTDYNDRCFHVSQAFFPRTGAWANLKKVLKVDFEEGVWDHLAGTTSAPFEPGEHSRIAVKVIDDRGNELMVVRELNGVRR